MRAVLARLPGILLLLLAIWGGYRYVWPLFKPQPPEMDVQTATVQRGDLRQVVPADGVIVPSVLVDVKSKAAGVVEKIYVEVGDQVKVGQLLAELDKKEIQSQLKQAEADLLAAQANLALVKRNLSPQQQATGESAIRSAEIDVDRAKDELAKQQAAYQRIKELFDKGYATQEEQDNAEAALNTAQTAYDSAVERLKSAQQQLHLDLQGGQKEQIASAAAAVVRQQAAVDSRREELGYTTIRAPIAGTVLARDIEIGTAVTSGTSGNTGGTVVATIGDLETLYVKAAIDETDLGRVAKGGSCRITFDAYQGWVWSGSVKKVYPQGQTSGGSGNANSLNASGGTKFQVDVAIDLKSGKRDFNSFMPSANQRPGSQGGAGGGGFRLGGRRQGGGGTGSRRRGGGGAGRGGFGAGPPGTEGGAGAPGGAGRHHGRGGPPPQLYPNMTASVEVVLEDHPNVVLIPAQFVKYGPDGKAYAEVIQKAAWDKFQADEKKAAAASQAAAGGKSKAPKHPEQLLPREHRELTLGFSDGLRQEIKAGLSENEVVILERPIKKE